MQKRKEAVFMRQIYLVFLLCLFTLFTCTSCTSPQANAFENETLGVSLTLGMTKEAVSDLLGQGRELPANQTSSGGQNRLEFSVFSYGEAQDTVYVTYLKDTAVSYSTWHLSAERTPGPFHWTTSGLGYQSSLEDMQTQHPKGTSISENGITVFQDISAAANWTASFDGEGMIFLLLGNPEYVTDYVSETG